MISQLVFDLTPEQIQRKGEEQLKWLEHRIAELISNNAPRAFIDLDLALAQVSNNLGVSIFLKYVSTDDAVRTAADQLETKHQKWMVDLFAREDLFKVVKKAESERETLDSTQIELLNDYLFQFKRNGLELPSDQKKAFLDKKKRLVELEAEFSKNLLKENTPLEFTREELTGLPESFISSLTISPNGLYQVTLSYPHVTPFMENVRSEAARKKMSFHFNSRGGLANKKLLEEAASLRQELAQMLGYENHASLVLSRRMALDPQKVELFLKDLFQKLKSVGAKEREALIQIKKKLFNNDQPLTSFEWRYLHNQILKTHFDVDPLEVQNYFPLEKVVEGMFEVYQKLLGVEFRKDTSAPVWHSSVQKFEVWKSGQLVSHFYMDLFPRPGKYNHAAAFTLVSAFLGKDGVYQIPFSSIVANFSAPSQERPSLLLHTEVETLFHEFGHIMHQVLTTARYPSFSGTGVKTDFVEAPSQMFENWVWDKEMLRRLSGHYLSPHNPLPNELIEKILAAKNLNSGLHYLRQIAFGLIDLEIHTRAACDSSEVYERHMREVLEIPVLEGTMPQASFGHLMGGYDAGYYGYLWAEVFAQDMFTRFEKEGLLNSETGIEYRKWILEPGGEQPPLALISGFLKREPNSDAFLKSLGIS